LARSWGQAPAVSDVARRWYCRHPPFLLKSARLLYAIGRRQPICSYANAETSHAVRTAQEKLMIKFAPVALGLIFALQPVPAARAQVTLDVAKITCEQLRTYKITRPENIAIWLSGYYH